MLKASPGRYPVRFLRCAGMTMPMSSSRPPMPVPAAAASFGAATGGRLRVVHVRMWDPAVRGGGARFYLETSEEATAVLERALTSVWERGVAASGVIVDAPRQRLARAIAIQAQAWRAEVLVVARRPRTALGALVLGSLPEKLMREASCPVLVLRQPRK